MKESSTKKSFSEVVIICQMVFSFVLLLIVGTILMMGFWVEPKGVIDPSVTTVSTILLSLAGAGIGINAMAENRKLNSATKLNTELTRLHSQLLEDIKAEVEFIAKPKEEKKDVISRENQKDR